MGDAFRIERELEGGGMSRLFVAVESSLNRKVVVKLLPPEFANEVSAARFKQEVELAAQLQHPHILPVLSAGARDGLLYYIMPYVHGESLRHRIMREGALPVADAMRILLEIADALATAHAGGIIHRDIKPENILLEGKHAVLADFGIARAIVQSRTGSALTSTGSSVGTPGYMSPEQFSGDAVDASTDVYALAVVGYEMLAGHPPFIGGTAQALLKAHLTATPRPVNDIRSEVPRRVSDALAKAMAKMPGERFHSVADFADAIEPTAAQVRAISRVNTRLAFRMVAGLAALAAVVAAVLVARRGRVSEETASRVAVLADSGRTDDIAALLAGSSLSDSRLKKSAPRFIGAQPLVLSNPKAHLTLTRATPFATFASRRPAWQGVPSGDSIALIAGEYVLRTPVAPSDTLTLLLDVQPGANPSRVIQLPPTDSAGAFMRVVSAGPSPTGAVVDAFLMDRSEVSNAEFQRFIAAGGYRTESLWPATMVVGGESLPRAQALAKFVDRSGLPGPRFWTSGRFTDGEADHPVVGVTWYEAAAFAAWAGKSLPTADQWWRAALGERNARSPERSAIFPWGRDGASIDVRANLDGTGTKGRGTMPLGMSPFGVEHLAGNAREWLADSTRGVERRIVVGGSWQDPSYMFERSHAEAFSPGFSNDAIGFRLVRAPLPK
jgi:formylglycine-generating enzyme required for sulfatase activity